MELATVAAGLIALRFVRFPFVTAPIAFALWYMSMDLTPIIAGSDDFEWELRKQVSMWFGALIHRRRRLGTHRHCRLARRALAPAPGRARLITNSSGNRETFP